MPEMPKPKRIPLPPSPEAPPRKFVVPPRPTSVDARIFDPGTDPALQDVQQAIANLQTACETVHRGATALHSDEMRTPAARHHAALDHAAKVLKPSLMSSDTARARLIGLIDALKAKTSVPAPIRDALAAEARQMLRTLKPAERSKVILGACKEGDDTLASACLNASPALSGMSGGEIARIRQIWGATRFPAEVARVSALEAGLGHLDRASGLALKYSLSVADRRIVDAALATQRRAQEAIAEASRPLLN